ncbi:hypothetical protein Cob_v003905 [Colletotrichum orbiculare MAFF 240422]|uniref:Uncharacterized protein n=1 Tax=Colletotrichum orbiculare (strain 104-T / ATCC 96160 / CBS 514.97 / LARS 414 / MAFF 240422) TaxID=1213857 RepID=A0A484G0F3_COLOR|nr:hypothetical protein Cob_v003905 [Colletotrichum orbiculare MAFF 240422]
MCVEDHATLNVCWRDSGTNYAAKEREHLRSYGVLGCVSTTVTTEKATAAADKYGRVASCSLHGIASRAAPPDRIDSPDQPSPGPTIGINGINGINKASLFYQRSLSPKQLY